MSTEYTASVRIEDGSLTVVRPHPSIGPIDDLVDSLIYTVRDDSTIVAVEVTVEVDDLPPAVPQADDPRAPRQPGSPPPAADDTPTLSASATGSLNPPVPAPDPLSGSGA